MTKVLAKLVAQFERTLNVKKVLKLISLQVLQQSVDRELNMYSDLKERTNKVAQIMMLSLSSQPVDHEENGRFKLRSTETGKYPNMAVSLC